jgi:hypothetical protein
MTAPVKCWVKTADGEEGEVVLDPSLARYLEFGSFKHGSGMEWPQEQDEDDWFEDDEDDEEGEAEEPVFLSVIFHDDGTLTADGDEVVEHREVPDWAWHAGMPRGMQT